MRSKSAAKGSRQSAQQSAADAFQARPPTVTSVPTTPADPARAGRQRLVGAFEIDIDRLEADPTQPRKHMDAEHLAELVASIRQLGILQPISVRFVEEAARYRIIAGERRFTAAKRAGLTSVPCWVRTPKEEEILLHQIVENWHRSDLNPFELADSLALLQESNGYSQQELVSITGKSKGEISKTMAILELAPEVQAIARADESGQLSKRHLYAVSRMTPERQANVVQRIARQQLTATDVERMLERQTRSADPLQESRPVRRTFRTTQACVTVSSDSNTLEDDDVLRALQEVGRQIASDAADR